MIHETSLSRLIDDMNEIEKVVVEMKAARTENREPSEEVRAIFDRWDRDRPADDLTRWLKQPYSTTYVKSHKRT